MMFEIGDKVILKRQGAGIYGGYDQEYEVITINPNGEDTYRITNKNHTWWCYEHQLDPAYVLPDIVAVPDGLASILGVV